MGVQEFVIARFSRIYLKIEAAEDLGLGRENLAFACFVKIALKEGRVQLKRTNLDVGKIAGVTKKRYWPLFTTRS